MIYLKSIIFHNGGLIEFTIDMFEGGIRVKDIPINLYYSYAVNNYNNIINMFWIGEIEEELNIKFMNDKIREFDAIKKFLSILTARFKIKNDRVIYLTLTK